MRQRRLKIRLVRTYETARELPITWQWRWTRDRDQIFLTICRWRQNTLWTFRVSQDSRQASTWAWQIHQCVTMIRLSHHMTSVHNKGKMRVKQERSTIETVLNTTNLTAITLCKKHLQCQWYLSIEWLCNLHPTHQWVLLSVWKVWWHAKMLINPRLTSRNHRCRPPN